MSKDVHALSQESMDLLEAHDWPGNIRELENVIERAVALEKSQTILPESLPEHIVRRVPKGPGRGRVCFPRPGFNLEEHVKGLEKEYIAQALATRGRRAGESGRAARHELPLVPLLRQEVQPEVTSDIMTSARVRLWLFLLFQALYALTSSGNAFRVPDEFEVYYQVEHLVDAGDLSIPQASPPVGSSGDSASIKSRTHRTVRSSPSWPSRITSGHGVLHGSPASRGIRWSGRLS